MQPLFSNEYRNLLDIMTYDGPSYHTFYFFFKKQTDDVHGRFSSAD
jgi:hypothetical protein